MRKTTKMSTDAETLVREYWRLMNSNRFELLGAVLSEEIIIEWPQSLERIRGLGNYVRVNAEYPSKGPWRFTVNRLVATETEVVTQTSVTDGETKAEAVSFFLVADGKITKLVEYWPESYAAPTNRSHLVESMQAGPKEAKEP